MHFQMTSHNGSAFEEGNIVLSTVMLPTLRGSKCYESCIFVDGDSEVLAKYSSISEAVLGHIELTKKFNLKDS